MAPRTGPDGLLAVAAKTKSAAFAALLVAAVLLLGGCGGGDSSSEQGTASTPAASSQGQGTQGADGKAQGPGDSAGGSASNGQRPKGSSQGSGPGSEKHGKHVVLPEGEAEPTATPAERAQATIASLTLSSPSLGAPTETGSSLPAKYTCAGADTWPTLRWTGVPAGTAELTLLVLAQEPVNGALSYNWAVAGIDPATQEIQSSELPPGAIIGKNSFGKTGYSICPPQGKAETYLFQLYAVPEALRPAKGFDPSAQHDRLLGAAGNVGLLAVVAG